MSTDTSAASIAMDLATAIHTGLIRPDDRLPSQTELMAAYGVAMATAASALRKVRDAGLTRSEPGRGVYALSHHRRNGDVAALYQAGNLCRSVASTTFRPGSDPIMEVGGYDDWDGSEIPGRRVNVAALVALDRTVARVLGDTFTAAARRIVGHGRQETDQQVIDAARAILHDGGHRPDGQPAIAFFGGTLADEDRVAERLWPNIKETTPEGAPF